MSFRWQSLKLDLVDAIKMMYLCLCYAVVCTLIVVCISAPWRKQKIMSPNDLHPTTDVEQSAGRLAVAGCYQKL